MLSEIISAGASLAGGWLNNERNQQNQREQNWWNYALQLQNQQWQAEMSNTAYQRGVKDMKAAGLNPAMMFGGKGDAASSPSGGTVGTSYNSQPSDFISPAVQRALEAYNIGSQVQQREADIENRQRQNEQIEATTAKLISEKNNVDADTTLKLIDRAPRQLQPALIRSQINANISSARHSESAAAELSARQGTYTSQIRRQNAEAAKTEFDTDFKRRFGGGSLTNFGDWGQAITNSAHGFAKTIDRLNSDAYPKVLDRNNVSKTFQRVGNYYNQPY